MASLSKYLPRVALVTGAAQGIGRAIASRLAHDGIDVAINDIPRKEAELKEFASELESLGRKVVVVPADVGDEVQVKNMVKAGVDSLGSLDIMVANAGIYEGGPLIEVSSPPLDRMLDVNIRGVLFCYKHAALQMIKQRRGGRILGASSIAGRKGALNISVYAATKFAVRGLTQSFALEMAPHEITVNAYLPGMMMTPLLKEYFGVKNRPQHEMEQEWAERFKEAGLPPNLPKADPAVIGSLVSYLCKPEAYFITGQSIAVEGSWGVGMN